MALTTAAVVVLIDVEERILPAMVLSLLQYERHSYRPHTAVPIEDEGGQWRQIPPCRKHRARPDW